MKIWKLVIVTFALLGSLNAQAIILEFNDGYNSCVFGGTPPNCIGPVSGSYVTMDGNADGLLEDREVFPISMNSGIIIDSVQSANDQNFGIDNSWSLLNIEAFHQTTSPVSIISATSNTMQLDFSGWGIRWNGFDISLSGDSVNFPGDTGIATVVCAVDCSVGDSYMLDYEAGIALLDPSNLGGVPYVLHLEGVIAAVPVPAAIWLFGSGLIALVGFSRRRNT